MTKDELIKARDKLENIASITNGEALYSGNFKDITPEDMDVCRQALDAQIKEFEWSEKYLATLNFINAIYVRGKK